MVCLLPANSLQKILIVLECISGMLVVLLCEIGRETRSLAEDQENVLQIRAIDPAEIGKVDRSVFH